MELDDHIFTEKQWETQQRGAIPCLRQPLRWCLGASWKAQAELRDTNCQGAKRQLVDDQVGPAVALGGRVSAWPLFPLCNRNPPDPEPKRWVGRGVERKVKGRVKVTFPGWVCLEPQVSGFLLKWRLIFHTGRGLWFGLSGENSPISHSQQPQT